MLERRPYAPPTDPDAPLDAVEQALVRMFVRTLGREIRAGASWWTDDDLTTPADPVSDERPKPVSR